MTVATMKQKAADSWCKVVPAKLAYRYLPISLAVLPDDVRTRILLLAHPAVTICLLSVYVACAIDSCTACVRITTERCVGVLQETRPFPLYFRPYITTINTKHRTRLVIGKNVKA
jgi:hypothetical protein